MKHLAPKPLNLTANGRIPFAPSDLNTIFLKACVIYIICVYMGSMFAYSAHLSFLFLERIIAFRNRRVVFKTF